MTEKVRNRGGNEVWEGTSTTNETGWPGRSRRVQRHPAGARFWYNIAQERGVLAEALIHLLAARPLLQELLQLRLQLRLRLQLLRAASLAPLPAAAAAAAPAARACGGGCTRGGAGPPAEMDSLAGSAAHAAASSWPCAPHTCGPSTCRCAQAEPQDGGAAAIDVGLGRLRSACCALCVCASRHSAGHPGIAATKGKCSMRGAVCLLT